MCACEYGTYGPQQCFNKLMSLSVGFSRSSNAGFVLGSTSQQSDFTNINTCMNGHANSRLHSNMPRHTHSNAHPSMAGHTQTHGHQTSSVPNFSMAATQAFLDSPTEDTQHYIGKNTSFSSINCRTSRLFFAFFPQKANIQNVS